MKKKNYFYAAALALGLTFTMGACSDEDDPTPNPGGGDEPEQQDPYNLDYTADNASAWGNYMYNVAMLLDQDSKDLYSYWNEDYEGKGPYATLFKEQTGGAYSSALACIQEMVESGMWNIANEVGDAKIKDPWEKYTSGDTEGGLYAVESWSSWHSRDDYTNNIFSIRNTYYGRIDDNDVDKVDGNLNAYASYTDFDDAGDIAENSLSNLIASVNPELDEKIKTLIFESAKAIQAIPQPFRNNIDSEESVAAMDKCMELASCLLDELHPYVTEEFADSKYDAQLDAVHIRNQVAGLLLGEPGAHGRESLGPNLLHRPGQTGHQGQGEAHVAPGQGDGGHKKRPPRRSAAPERPIWTKEMTLDCCLRDPIAVKGHFCSLLVSNIIG